LKWGRQASPSFLESIQSISSQHFSSLLLNAVTFSRLITFQYGPKSSAFFASIFWDCNDASYTYSHRCFSSNNKPPSPPSSGPLLLNPSHSYKICSMEFFSNTYIWERILSYSFSHLTFLFFRLRNIYTFCVATKTGGNVN
jgi:hypothetical protein